MAGDDTVGLTGLRAEIRSPGCPLAVEPQNRPPAIFADSRRVRLGGEPMFPLAVLQPEVIEKFEAYWPSGSKARLALYILLYTTQRRSDAVRLGRQHRRGDTLRYRAQKDGPDAPELVIPLHPDLKAELDRLPATQMTFIMTEYGKPFSAAGFTNWFSDCAKKAGLPLRSSPHGLRKAGSRRLAEASATANEIGAVTGHRTLKEVERYTKSAEQQRLAEAAMAKLKDKG